MEPPAKRPRLMEHQHQADRTNDKEGDEAEHSGDLGNKQAEANTRGNDDLGDEEDYEDTDYSGSQAGSAHFDDDDLLAQERAKLDNRFQQAMANIYAKYSKNFEGIGDEVNLDTGEVIINNGHLQNMRYEGDVGLDEDPEEGGVRLEDLTDKDFGNGKDVGISSSAHSEGWDKSCGMVAGNVGGVSDKETDNTSLLRPGASLNNPFMGFVPEPQQTYTTAVFNPVQPPLQNIKEDCEQAQSIGRKAEPEDLSALGVSQKSVSVEQEPSFTPYDGQDSIWAPASDNSGYWPRGARIRKGSKRGKRKRYSTARRSSSVPRDRKSVGAGHQGSRGAGLNAREVEDLSNYLILGDEEAGIDNSEDCRRSGRSRKKVEFMGMTTWAEALQSEDVRKLAMGGHSPRHTGSEQQVPAGIDDDRGLPTPPESGHDTSDGEQLNVPRSSKCDTIPDSQETCTTTKLSQERPHSTAPEVQYLAGDATLDLSDDESPVLFRRNAKAGAAKGGDTKLDRVTEEEVDLPADMGDAIVQYALGDSNLSLSDDESPVLFRTVKSGTAKTQARQGDRASEKSLSNPGMKLAKKPSSTNRGGVKDVSATPKPSRRPSAKPRSAQRKAKSAPLSVTIDKVDDLCSQPRLLATFKGIRGKKKISSIIRHGNNNKLSTEQQSAASSANRRGSSNQTNRNKPIKRSQNPSKSLENSVAPSNQVQRKTPNPKPKGKSNLKKRSAPMDWSIYGDEHELADPLADPGDPSTSEKRSPKRARKLSNSGATDKQIGGANHLLNLEELSVDPSTNVIQELETPMKPAEAPDPLVKHGLQLAHAPWPLDLSIPKDEVAMVSAEVEQDSPSLLGPCYASGALSDTASCPPQCEGTEGNEMIDAPAFDPEVLLSLSADLANTNLFACGEIGEDQLDEATVSALETLPVFGANVAGTELSTDMGNGGDPAYEVTASILEAMPVPEALESLACQMDTEKEDEDPSHSLDRHSIPDTDLAAREDLLVADVSPLQQDMEEVQEVTTDGLEILNMPDADLSGTLQEKSKEACEASSSVPGPPFASSAAHTRAPVTQREPDEPSQEQPEPIMIGSDPAPVATVEPFDGISISPQRRTPMEEEAMPSPILVPSPISDQLSPVALDKRGSIEKCCRKDERVDGDNEARQGSVSKQSKASAIRNESRKQQSKSPPGSKQSRREPVPTSPTHSFQFESSPTKASDHPRKPLVVSGKSQAPRHTTNTHRASPSRSRSLHEGPFNSLEASPHFSRRSILTLVREDDEDDELLGADGDAVTFSRLFDTASRRRVWKSSSLTTEHDRTPTKKQHTNKRKSSEGTKRKVQQQPAEPPRASTKDTTKKKKHKKREEEKGRERERESEREKKVCGVDGYRCHGDFCFSCLS